MSRAGFRWPDGLLSPGEPDAAGRLRPDGASTFLILCDHAGALVPRRLGDLGAPPGELDRHTAVDIGALGVCERLSARLDAELVFQRYSRLVIDCNRPPHEPSAFVVETDGARIGANAALTATQAAARVAEVFMPYHAAIQESVARRLREGRPPVLVSVHSFTPVHSEHPAPRPWHVGVLFNRDDRLGRALAARLEAEGDLVVGVNEPYRVDDAGDYAIPVHAERLGLLHVEVEIRQDGIADREGQRAWGDRLARLLPAALAGVAAPAEGLPA